MKDTHAYIDDLIPQDGNWNAKCILKNLLQVAKDMLKYLLKDDGNKLIHVAFTLGDVATLALGSWPRQGFAKVQAKSE